MRNAIDTDLIVSLLRKTFNMEFKCVLLALRMNAKTISSHRIKSFTGLFWLQKLTNFYFLSSRNNFRQNEQVNFRKYKIKMKE